MREKIKKEGNFPVLILKFNTAWYLIIILWHLCPWVNLHNRLWQILPDQSVLPRSWTLEGSAALWFWKGHALQRPGTEGVTAVAEPQQTDHLAARVDKGAPEAWQETHKHWYLPGGGGDSRLQSAQTPNTAGSAANTCTLSSTHTQLPNTASRAFTSACNARDNLTRSLEQLQPVLAYSPLPSLQMLSTNRAAGGTRRPTRHTQMQGLLIRNLPLHLHTVKFITPCRVYYYSSSINLYENDIML